MPSLTPALRFEVLQALERARERVARGAPNLQVAFHLQRLTPRAWAEVDRAVDEVRFTVPAGELLKAALSQGAHNADGLSLRDDLRTAQANARLYWESEEGHSRAECVALLFIAREFLKQLPVVSAGPLLPSLPIR